MIHFFQKTDKAISTDCVPLHCSTNSSDPPMQRFSLSSKRCAIVYKVGRQSCYSKNTSRVMDGSCKCIKIKPKEDQALLRQDLLKWNVFTTITCGMETSIILKGHYRSSKTLAPTDFPKMLINSLWCISVRLANGEKFMFMPCAPPPTSLLSSPRANLTESVKKGSLLCWELPQGPQE